MDLSIWQHHFEVQLWHDSEEWLLDDLKAYGGVNWRDHFEYEHAPICAMGGPIWRRLEHLIRVAQSSP